MMSEVTIAGNSEDDASGCCANVSTNGRMTISDSALEGTCSPGIADDGHNLALAGGGCPGKAASARSGSAAFDLGPLQDNGGATATMLPGAGSALIDAVPRRAGCLRTDQRGISRPQGRACDAGAVEVRGTRVTAHPARVRFGCDRIGRSSRRTVRLTFARGDLHVRIGKAKIVGSSAPDFKLVADNCRAKRLARVNSCSLVISFRPRTRGRRTATLIIATGPPSAPARISLVGTGLS